MRDLGKCFSQGSVLWWSSGGSAVRGAGSGLLRSSSLLSLRQVDWAGGPKEQTGDYVLQGFQHWHKRPSTSLALKPWRQGWTSPSLSLWPNSSGCLSGLQSVRPGLPFGQPEETEDQLGWVSGSRDDSWLDRMWNLVSEGDASWDLPPLSQDWGPWRWKWLGTLPFLPRQRITFIW